MYEYRHGFHEVLLKPAGENGPDAVAECGIAHTGDMSQPVAKPAPKPAPTGFRVLVVDDERALADLVGSYLTRDGFEVSMARDGQQAIEAARQVDPDVMVLDLGLPVIDGVEVCRVVRTFSDCYIIMLTARTDEIDNNLQHRVFVVGCCQLVKSFRHLGICGGPLFHLDVLLQVFASIFLYSYNFIF